MLNKKMKNVIPMTLGLSLMFASTSFAATPALDQSKQPVNKQVNASSQETNPYNWDKNELGSNTALQQALHVSKEELNEKLASGKSLDDLAKEKGVNTDKVADALLDHDLKELDKNLQSGKVSQAEYNQAKTKLQQQAKAYMNEKNPEFEGNYKLAAVAKLLGMEKSKLVEKLKDGKDIDDIAESKGIDDEDVVDAVLKVEKEKISAFVKKSWNGKNSMTEVEKQYFEESDYLEKAADELDLSVNSLKKLLNQGHTIAEICKEQDVDLKDVAQKLEKEAKKAIQNEISKNGHYFQ